jgi:hypothetical protein
MATFPVPLDSLISYVRALQPDGGPLDDLAGAVMVGEQLSEQGDALMGHFVDRARSSGASWSQIGAAMGVTKQAAQKRFVIRDNDLIPEGRAFSRFAPRARGAVAAAGQLAGVAGAEAVDVSHLAAGLLAEDGGLAARAIHRLETDDSSVFAALGTGPAAGGYDSDPATLRQLRFTPAAQGVLRQSLKSALRFGHNYIGTEHLLLGVVHAGGEVSDRLAGVGVTPALVERAVEVELAQAQLERARRAGSGA